LCGRFRGGVLDGEVEGSRRIRAVRLIQIEVKLTRNGGFAFMLGADEKGARRSAGSDAANYGAAPRAIHRQRANQIRPTPAEAFGSVFLLCVEVLDGAFGGDAEGVTWLQRDSSIDPAAAGLEIQLTFLCKERCQDKEAERKDSRARVGP